MIKLELTKEEVNVLMEAVDNFVDEVSALLEYYKHDKVNQVLIEKQEKLVNISTELLNKIINAQL